MYRPGQIIILVLLLSLLGLTTGLSVASRSLSDLKQATQVDVGTKAFAAAEAGLEYGLNQLSVGGPNTGSLSLPGATVNYQINTSMGNIATVPVTVDDVTELNLSAVTSNTKSFDIFWQGNGQIEAIIVDKDSKIRRFVFNAYGTSGHSFSSGVSTTDTTNCPVSCLTGYSGYTSCTGDSIDFQSNDKLLRIKALSNSTPVLICALNAGKSQINMPTPIITVTVTATTTNGTVKKIQITKTPPFMPAIFDNVLYTGGSIIR